MAVVRGFGAEGEEELLLNGHGVSAAEDEKILEKDGGDMVASQCECT